MRLGEIKSTIDKVLSEDQKLNFNVDNLYGGQLFRVSSYASLMKALIILSNQPWVNSENEIVTELVKKFGKKRFQIDITPEQHQQLANLINDINNNLPIYYSILDQLVEKQSPYTVNIKIPEEYVGDLEKLNKFNDELQDVFKLIVINKGLNGGVRFAGFDVGTSWYKIIIESGVVDAGFVYAGFLGVIKIAKELIGLRKDWLECEERKLNLKILNQKLEEGGHKALTDKKHIEMLFKNKAEEEIAKLIEELPEQPTPITEVQTSLVKGFNKLVQMMEVGAEFHPSLNPPSFIQRDYSGSIMIDYDDLRAEIESKKKKAVSDTKQIENKTESKETDES